MSAEGQECTQAREAGRQRPVLRAASALVSLLSGSGKIIAVVCLVCIFVALVVNVSLRYLLGYGFAWAYEIHALLLPWLVAGGVVIASARGHNIAITLLPDLLPPKARLVLAVVIQVAIVTIALSVLWTSQPILRAAQFQTLSTFGVTQIWGYASLVYAFGAMAVIAVLDIVRLLVGGVEKERDPTAASLS